MRIFEQEKHGYKKSEVDYYIRRLDEDFQTIMRGQAKRFSQMNENIGELKEEVRELSKELNEYDQVFPEFKSEFESLRERLQNIRQFANQASECRYLATNDPEIILANLIMQTLEESSNIEKLKPIKSPKRGKRGTATEEEETQETTDIDFFELLATSKELKLDEALEGFEFFDNNPFKKGAEKKLKKIDKKKKR